MVIHEFRFEWTDNENCEVTAHDHPEMEGCVGRLVGNNMAFFYTKGKELFIANTHKGIARKIATEDGIVLIDDNEIDFQTIQRECNHGQLNAQDKVLRYGGMGNWDGFKDGLCVLCWTIYPDGQYFGDSDGFGMDDNDEVNIYGIINTDLEFVEPFRPVKNIGRYLEKKRRVQLV